ncbi:MAG: alpha/beta fold hydrolase [Chitinophagaceae bacterium]
MGAKSYFILPGLNNSGPGHWQTHWENEYGFTRIQQADWNHPVAEDWIQTMDAAIVTYPLKEVVLIGHSLACNTIVQWAARYNHIIKAALLVAPSDTEAPSYPQGTSGFAPMPLNRLPFPSVIVTSSNDEYVTPRRAQFFAANWGSDCIDAGILGHINAASGIGNWPQGFAILEQLVNR